MLCNFLTGVSPCVCRPMCLVRKKFILRDCNGFVGNWILSQTTCMWWTWILFATTPAFLFLRYASSWAPTAKCNSICGANCFIWYGADIYFVAIGASARDRIVFFQRWSCFQGLSICNAQAASRQFACEAPWCVTSHSMSSLRHATFLGVQRLSQPLYLCF